MSYSQLILRDSAEIVWPLDDLDESSSVSKPINFFSNDPYTYSASINSSYTNIINTPIVFGGGKALSFTASSVGLSIPAIGRFSELYDNKDSVISFWFQSNVLFHDEYPIFKKRGQDNIGLYIKDNYLIFRYGTSASYYQVSADVIDFTEPHHLIVSKTKGGLYLMIDGLSYSTFNDEISLLEDPNYVDNNYIDFYGPPSGSWIVDSIAIYPNSLNEQTAKRHYIYGLGKNVSDDVFYSRGGSLYNLSTISTERLADINWDYPEEWRINEFVDLYLDSQGIRSLNFPEPYIYSFDNLLDKSNDSISFNLSSSATKASYIQIDRLNNKIGGGEYPFLLKIRLDGPLPDKYISQRLISYGRFPENEIIKFDLFNNDGQYEIRVSTISSASTSFNINNSASSIYIGMSFVGYTNIYFAEDGQQIQTASFSYYDENGFGLDPLTSYFPPTSDIVLRIGSSLNYNQSSFTNEVYDVEQFTGTIEKFIITQPDFVASATYSYIENYNKPRYSFTYNTEESRFKVQSYGYGNFNIHTISMSEYIDDSTQKIGANVIKIGYPDITSASQVFFYATLIDYQGNIVHPRTRLSQNNYLNFLNNRNLSDMYIKFDFEIFGEDITYYPPRIRLFQMQTFKSKDNTTILRDEAGPNYILYPTTSSTVYVPEIRYTPTSFITKNSGIKLNETIVDFTENISPKALDPRIIDGLTLWLDSRFINGLDKQNPFDDTRILTWSDLSDNFNNAVSSSVTAPIFRTQSMNVLRSNQLTGSDTGDLSFIIPVNSTVESSPDGAISGPNGLKITPNGSSTDSYLDLTYNTASITTAPNQSYVVVGSIKLNKPQTASALHQNARKIVILSTDGITETFTASTNAAPNAKGIYSLSATFNTPESSIGSIIKLYNGSYSEYDTVYWDNVGLYPITSSAYPTSWINPMTVDDRPVVRFNKNSYIYSSASITHPSSVYVTARNFGDGAFISSTSSSVIYSNSASYFISYGLEKSYSISNNSFNIFSVLNDGVTASVFINSEFIGSKPVGSNNIDGLFIGNNLYGDIASVLVFDRVNNSQDRQKIENWLKESFRIY